jgi:hypothetical protein
MAHIKDLSESNARLLCFGAKQTGSFLEAYRYVEESLYIDEAPELYKFCEFLDNEVGGASIHNIFILFRAYKNPNDPTLKRFVDNLKAQIQEIKDMIGK